MNEVIFYSFTILLFGYVILSVLYTIYVTYHNQNSEKRKRKLEKERRQILIVEIYQSRLSSLIDDRIKMLNNLYKDTLEYKPVTLKDINEKNDELESISREIIELEDLQGLMEIEESDNEEVSDNDL